MDIKDLFKLIDAGFTKEDIMKLYSASTNGESVQENVQAESTEETKAESTVSPETKVEAPASDPRLDEIIKGLQKVTETMQKTAVQTSRQPEVTETVDDFLAKIIDPTYKKE